MNERGSILTTVLLLAGLLVILAVPVLQVANAGYKTSVNEQIKTQAFYLAEAGKEHFVQLADEAIRAVAATTMPAVPISHGPETVSLGSGSYTASYKITGHPEPDKYLVEVVSSAQVGAITQVARQTIVYTIVPASGAGSLPTAYALFVHTGTIPANDSGKLFIDEPKGIADATDFYTQVPFPSSLEELTIKANNVIDKDGYYNAIDLKGRGNTYSKLTITTGNSETAVRKVRVPSITLHKADIVVSGKGRLLLYVDGDIAVGQDCRLTSTPDGAVVELYSNGNIAAAKGDNSDEDFMFIQRTLLFAPQAQLDVDNHVRADGAIIVGRLAQKQHLDIYYSDVFKGGSYVPSGYVQAPVINIDKQIWSPRLP